MSGMPAGLRCDASRPPGPRARPGGGAGAVAAVFLVLGGFLGPGCEGDAPPRVRLRVEVREGIPEKVDQVRVTVAALRTLPDASPVGLCVPVVRSRDLADPSHAPFLVDLIPGPVYDQAVIFRVEWLLDDRVVNTAGLLVRVPDAGTTEVTALHDPDCLAASCAPGEYCSRSGDGRLECRPNGVLEPILTPAGWDAVSCDPDAEPLPPS